MFLPGFWPSFQISVSSRSCWSGAQNLWRAQHGGLLLLCQSSMHCTAMGAKVTNGTVKCWACHAATDDAKWHAPRWSITCRSQGSICEGFCVLAYVKLLGLNHSKGSVRFCGETQESESWSIRPVRAGTRWTARLVPICLFFSSQVLFLSFQKGWSFLRNACLILLSSAGTEPTRLRSVAHIFLSRPIWSRRS